MSTPVDTRNPDLPAMSGGAMAPGNSFYPAPPPGPLDHQPTDLESLIAMAFRRRWVVIGTIVLVLAIGTLFTVTRKPVYEATAQIVVVTSSGASGSGGDVSLIGDLQALTRSRPVDTQVAIIRSKGVLKSAGLLLSPELRVKGFGGDAIPSWAVSASAEESTDVIDIVTRAYDPRAAAELANSVSRAYFSMALRKNQQATQQAREYASKEMMTIEADLARANAALAAYKRRTGILSLDTEFERLAGYMAKLELDRDDARVQLAAATSQFPVLSQQLSREQLEITGGRTITRSLRDF